MQIDKSFRYDISGVMGSGCAVNIVTGARGCGKTYAWKKKCIELFIKRHWTWAYTRTFEEELKQLVSKGPYAFFSDIMENDEFPGWMFRVNGRLMQAGKVGKDGGVKRWETMGNLLALTQAQNYKGTTLATLHYVIFDEFIRETNIPPYPRDCVWKFYNLWDTLDRNSDRVRWVMLANAADVVNPYFAEWHITPPDPGRTKRARVGKDYAYIETFDNPKFTEATGQSAIGRFTAGSAYAAYARFNQFRNAGQDFVAPMPRRCQPQINIKWSGNTYCVYMSLDMDGTAYVSHKANHDAQTVALTKDDMSPNLCMIERNSPLLKAYGKYYRQGSMKFDSAATREKFANVLAMCGIH